jgi:hypothetical protein
MTGHFDYRYVTNDGGAIALFMRDWAWAATGRMPFDHTAS